MRVRGAPCSTGRQSLRGGGCRVAFCRPLPRPQAAVLVLMLMLVLLLVLVLVLRCVGSQMLRCVGFALTAVATRCVHFDLNGLKLDAAKGADHARRCQTRCRWCCCHHGGTRHGTRRCRRWPTDNHRSCTATATPTRPRLDRLPACSNWVEL